MPTISVIIPNYNHAKYLPLRIESVLSQSYPAGEMEVLILDDCSPDNSREIIMEYAAKDARIKVFFNEQNSGKTLLQWKKGLKEARGKYIWIAESDDYCSPDLLMSLYNILESNPTVGMAYCQSIQVDESDKAIKNMIEETQKFFEPARWKKDYIAIGTEEIQNYLIIQNTIPNASAVLFRKNIIDQFSDKIEHLANSKLVGDKLFYTEVLLRSDVGFCSTAHNYFRKHSNNVRSKSSGKANLIDNLNWINGLIDQIKLSATMYAKVQKRYFGWWLHLCPNPVAALQTQNHDILIAAKKLFKNPYIYYLKHWAKHRIAQLIK